MAARKGRSAKSRGKLNKSAADAGRSTGARVRPVSINDIRRVVRDEISTLNNADWLGPQQPVPPQAPPDQDFRGWDYPPGYNVNYQSRKYSPYTAQQLQWLADSFDLLRQVIERRKSHFTSLKWDIVSREGEDVDEEATRGIKEFLRHPDRIGDYPRLDTNGHS